MDGPVVGFNEQLDPPARIFDRLRQIAGYTWDESKAPFHSSYDNWHIFGTRFVSPYSATASTLSPGSANAASAGSVIKLTSSSRASSADSPANLLASHSEAHSEHSGVSPAARSNLAADTALVEEAVVARVASHALREERAFQIAKTLSSTVDPHGLHIVKPIDLLRLTPLPGEKDSIIVAIYHFPGPNHLHRLLDLGPAFYWADKVGDGWQARLDPDFELEPPISLQHFLDFAIGAVQCLEIIHHGHGIVHGEIRGDAFHFNLEKNQVKLVSFGSGLRSFEHGLTSTGWSTLSKELGAKNKLLYISPEQTGRLPAEPDTRTDLYSLGVLFWSLLTQQPVYEGDSPLDIVQGVLGRRIPNVASVRIDVPDVLGRIIQKCTSKNVADRYHSASGLRYDLVKVQELLGAGDNQALKEWQIASKDVSSFFMLPNVMIGRDEEREQIVKVIERVAESHAMSQKGGTNRFSDGSGLSNEVLDGADGSTSEGASSVEGANRRSGSFTQTTSTESKPRYSYHTPVHSMDAQTISTETISSGNSNPATLRLPQRAWERHQNVAFEARSFVDTVGSDRDGSRHAAPSEVSSSLSRQLGSAKFRRRGQCEIITIEGVAGLGKSCLAQSVLAESRRRGYCASTKFDTTRRTAFSPLLKLLSSLFRQVWGERNTETPFHQSLKQYVRPMWSTLHETLQLPEFLLAPISNNSVTRSASNAKSPVHSKRPADGLKRRDSTPGSPGSLALSKGSSRASKTSTQSSQDFLHASAPTKSMRLMNTFLDVLRMFTNHKFITLCLDDLHFADAESLDLVTQIIAARLRMVIIITYRPEEMSSEKVQNITQPPQSEEFPRIGRPMVTKIQLSTLSENDITKYVAATLCKPEEDVSGLVMVISVKTQGNPFYMREMLNACYRKKCIWYDYHDSQWHYDVNRVFEQFQGDTNYDILNTDWITSRLNELPAASRSILAWAALLGNAFSFELICHLLTGEFHYIDDSCPEPQSNHYHTKYTQREAVAGLQAAIQACIITPSETDDRFRFAHDRYVFAASGLKECSARKMHFVIAQTLLKYYGTDPRSKDSTASHICEAIGIIKKRVQERRPYRDLLFDCARAAAENGARPTAAKYYSNALALLQQDPWTDDGDDASYSETLQLYLRAAECYLYMGQHSLANGVLSTIFTSAKTPLDKAPACVLQSRIYAQSGDALKALSCLKDCLKTIGIIQFDDNPSYEQCDQEFEVLSIKLQTMDLKDVLAPSRSSNLAVASVGAIFAEAVSAAWWSDDLSFYYLSIKMLDLHLSSGSFAQSGMAFLHVAMIALARFNMISFALDLGQHVLQLLDQFRDPYSMGRGYISYAYFIGHAQHSITSTVSQLEGSLEYGAAAGDRISAILSFGIAAQIKFFGSENCSDLENFCQYGCEQIPNWHLDTRGGTMLIAVRQVARAMQGKTRTSLARDVMTDEQHDAPSYKEWLENNTSNGSRSLLFYETLEMMPLFLYGHYDRAIEVGKTSFEKGHLIWSARNTRLSMLFYGLALAGVVLRRSQDTRQQPDNIKVQVGDTLKKLADLVRKIKDWSVVSDVNYLAWVRLLEAQISEISNNDGMALRQYEEALDHASEHGFLLEEALGNYLMAGIFIRNSARRSATWALRDAVGLYRQLGAVGVAERIEEEHSMLLHGPIRNPRTAEVGVQTDFAGDAPSAQYRVVVSVETERVADQPTQTAMAELRGERVGAWQGSMHAEAGAGLPALDMIDLHAILLSSQIISSVLRVDELLKTMCDVILQTCGGSATLAAIVVQDEGNQEWCVAASGDPERGAEAHMPRIPLTGTHLVAENVVLYSSRFRELVFIPDLVNDERFGNVSECWLEKNPQSKAVIAMPICHGDNPLLGVLYLEGVPGSFTDRNATVLQLLVNQIGISYSNALSMKAVEKVSAENVSMVQLQKRNLHKAIAAEGKAKDAEQTANRNLKLAEAAETEAKRNVKLAEEAAKAKSIFLANVSHELRTPLNGVIGNSELLRDNNLTSDQQEMAESIRLSADLLLAVINDILDFSRMEADKMKLYVIAFNPKEMVQEVVRAVSYRNQEKTSQGTVQIIKHIDLPTDGLIFGDPVRLHQVLGNLIGNSLKFTEKGSITIGARVDSESEYTQTLTFWVEDTGIGIPPAQLAKLFQPFSQADASTARKYGGSGLGLSICKSLIETMMKGHIHLDSTEGVGTRAWFTVTFDKAESDVSAGDLQTQVPSQALPEAPRSPRASDREPSPNPYMDLSHVSKEQLRVCIAEDNPINRKIAIQYIQRLGYKNVDAYDNGSKAVEALRLKAKEGRPYHVVLMDVQMPVLDGYEATKLLRKDPTESVRKVLVIAMTASAIQGDREKCLAAGMNDYLAKPVKSDVLKKKLDAYISVQQSHDSAEDSASDHTTRATSSQAANAKQSSASFVNSEINGSITKLPVRDSPSEVRLTDGSSAETTPTGPTKRQPRKLVKSRTNSEVDNRQAKTTLLHKKNLQRTGSNLADGVDPDQNSKVGENAAPYGAKKPDDGRRSQSFASNISSTNRDEG